MTSWYEVKMSWDDVTAGKNVLLQDQFESIFIQDAQQEVALFGSSEAGKSPIFYFSPAAAENPSIKLLIKMFSGVECTQPHINSALLVGHYNARKTLLCE